MAARTSGSSHLLWILGLVPIGYAVIAILENALRSLERSDEVFRAYAVAAAASCVIGVPLAWFWGVSGAVVGLVLPCGVSVASMVRSLRAQGPHYRAGRVKYHSIHPAGGDTAMPLNLQKRLALTLRHCGSSDRRLIDCGCGAGEYVISLQRLGVQAWGIEYDRDKVAEFRKRYATSQRLCVGDVSNAGLMGSSFDVALLNEVLEHVPDDRGALSEVHRILRDDGVLIVFSPNRRYPFETHGVSLARSGRRLPPYVPFVPYVPLWAGRLVFSYWARNYWPGELRRLVKEAGFTIVATDYVWQTFEAISRHQPALITAMAPLLRRTANLLERVPVIRSFGASQVIVARKSGTTRSGHSA